MPPRRNDDSRLIAHPGGPSTETDEDRAAIVQDVVNQLREDFARRDKLYEALDQVVYLEDEVRIPRAYQKTALEVHNPQALVIPTTVTAALSINPPRIQFPPVGKPGAVTVQENATKREHFFEASWRRQEEDAERQLFRAFMFSLVTYGEGILKTVERTKTAWAEYGPKSRALKARLDNADDPEYGGLDQQAKDGVYDAKTEEYKRGMPYPVCTTDVDPACFYYLKTLDGFSYVAEVSDVPYFEALDRFSTSKQQWSLNSEGQVVEAQNMGLPRAQWGQAMGSRGNKNLTLIELWKWDTCHYVLLGPGQRTASRGARSFGRGTVVKTVKHGYGNPYTKTLRGPYFHAQGITTNSRLPHRAGLGILTPYLDVIPAINQALTINGNAAWLTGFPSYARDVPPGAAEQPNPFGDDNTKAEGPEIVPGRIFPWGVKPIEQPRAGADFDKFLERLSRFMETALPRVLQGDIGDQSGYAVNQGQYVARLGWAPIVANAELAMARRTGFESWLIARKIRETVYAWGDQPAKGQRKQGAAAWLAIGPDDLGDAHTYNVSLDPETPSNKIIELRYHEGALNLRLETPDQAIEALGGNPDEVEEGWLLWEMKQDPAVRDRLKARIFQALGLADQKVLQGTAAQQSLTQPPIAPGASQLASGQQGGPAISDPGIGAVPTPGAGLPIAPPPPGGNALAARPFGPAGPAGPTPGAPGGIQGPPMRAMPLPGGR